MKLSEKIFFYDDITKHKNDIYSGVEQLEKEKEELIAFIEFCEDQGVEGIIKTYEEYTCKKWEDLSKIKE